MSDTNTNPETTPTADEDNGLAQTDPGADVEDTITRYAIYNTTLRQYVGGVQIGSKPSAKDAKALLAGQGMDGHDYEVHTV